MTELPGGLRLLVDDGELLAVFRLLASRYREEVPCEEVTDAAGWRAPECDDVDDVNGPVVTTEVYAQRLVKKLGRRLGPQVELELVRVVDDAGTKLTCRLAGAPDELLAWAGVDPDAAPRSQAGRDPDGRFVRIGDERYPLSRQAPDPPARAQLWKLLESADRATALAFLPSSEHEPVGGLVRLEVPTIAEIGGYVRIDPRFAELIEQLPAVFAERGRAAVLDRRIRAGRGSAAELQEAEDLDARARLRAERLTDDVYELWLTGLALLIVEHGVGLTDGPSLSRDPRGAEVATWAWSMSFVELRPGLSAHAAVVARVAELLDDQS